MSLTVHRSRRAEDLVASLARLLAVSTAGPLAQDAVVVHSRGLERWLGMQIAQRNGICANTLFLRPEELLGQTLDALLGPDADASAWTADRIAWAVLAALPDLAAHPALEPLRAFLLADDAAPGAEPDLGSRRAMGLAREVGGLFERYATYRPELVDSWLQGDGAGWEPPLWRAVASRLPGHDLGRLHRRLAEAIKDGADSPSLPARVAIFSVVTLPPVTVRLLADLARIRPVHVFVLNPSDAAWTDHPAQHPLLSSMGTLSRSFAETLLDTEPVVEDIAPPPQLPDSLLHALQRDLRANTLPAALPAIDDDDVSIQLHACHTPLRQVQVLRHVLLDLFERHPDLEPRDVLVMAPDIAPWAPLVQAVFGDGEPDWRRRDEHPGGLPRLPFAIADRGLSSTNPYADALLRALRLAGTRLKTSQVLELLDIGPVRRAFGVAPEDLPILRTLVVGAGARWAADSEHRASFGQPATERYTWRQALDRLLLGQAMSDQGELLFDVLPHGDVEGREARTLLGGLVDLVEVLLVAATDFERPRSITGWSQTLITLFDRLTTPGPEDWQAAQVRDGIAAIAEDAAAAGWGGEVDRGAIESLLDGRFTVSEPGSGYLSGGITFCRLTPMRSIPFRVVALLGMDDGAFPRRAVRLAVDRLEIEPRLGDRSPREDDRALFLESLLSARDALVISWTGSSPFSDRTLAPATPVAELLDVLDRTGRRLDGRSLADTVLTRHPLHAFSPLNVVATGPFSFDRRDAEHAAAWRHGRLRPEVVPDLVEQALAPIDLSARPATPAAAELRSVEIGALSWFFGDPIDAFFRTRLGLWPEDDLVGVIDREPSRLENGLPAWAVTDTLVRAALAGESIELHGPVWDKLVAGPLLPLGMPGEQDFLTAAAVAAGIAERITHARAGSDQPAETVTVSARDLSVSGHVDGLRDPQLRVVWRAGKPRERYVLDLWLHHLLLSAAGWAGESRMVAKGHDVLFQVVPPSQALAILEDLVLLYEVGQAVPLLFFPEPSREWAEALAAGESDPNLRRWPPRSYDCPRLPVLLGASNPFTDWFDGGSLVPSRALSAPALADRIWGPALPFLLTEVGGAE
jgi:exodeoxyribonuclease V gamma subunit